MINKSKPLLCHMLYNSQLIWGFIIKKKCHPFPLYSSVKSIWQLEVYCDYWCNDKSIHPFFYHRFSLPRGLWGGHLEPIPAILERGRGTHPGQVASSSVQWLMPRENNCGLTCGKTVWGVDLGDINCLWEVHLSCYLLIQILTQLLL